MPEPVTSALGLALFTRGSCSCDLQPCSPFWSSSLWLDIVTGCQQVFSLAMRVEGSVLLSWLV